MTNIWITIKLRISLPPDQANFDNVLTIRWEMLDVGIKKGCTRAAFFVEIWYMDTLIPS